MQTFTLDTNCVLAIDEGRPEAAAVRVLADGHTARKADVAVVAISASERQKDGLLIRNFGEFRERLYSLDLAHLDILKPMLYWDITFWDWSLWSDDDMQALEKRIYEILFPDIQFDWVDYCRVNNLYPVPTQPQGKWRNCKCDVQAIWSHIHHKRNVFVTNDRNFHAATKKAALIKLGANRIEFPKNAVALI
jgi:hypothetical protein